MSTPILMWEVEMARWSNRWKRNEDGSYTRNTGGESGAPVDLKSLKKPELVALANKAGLDSTGTKAELVARLEAAE